jgi:hypothetical protein
MRGFFLFYAVVNNNKSINTFYPVANIFKPEKRQLTTLKSKQTTCF